MNLLTFFITSIIIVVIPGTGVIYTVSTGITLGKKASIIAAVGCTCGIIPHLFISLALSSIIQSMDSRIFYGIKIAGAFYLLYLGITMMIAKSHIHLNSSEKNNTTLTIFRHAILINLLNPKLTLFFFSFLPQYIKTEDGHYFLQYLSLSLLFMLLTFIVFVGYGILAGSTEKFIKKSPFALSLIQKSFGVIFIVFSIQLGLSSV